MINTRLL